jgi:hypothetical protein
MIREAGISTGGHPMNPLQAYPEQFERFAAMVAAAEREACAKVCDDVNQMAYDNPDDWAPWEAADACAAAIRARGEA